jgi:hypothetical protein
LPVFYGDLSVATTFSPRDWHVHELHKAVDQNQASPQQGPAWRRLRDFRNLCAGHPARRSIGVPGAQRTFMGRSFGKYDAIMYELWDANTRQSKYPTVNLRQMINDYDKEASSVLDAVLSNMKSRWP